MWSTGANFSSEMAGPLTWPVETLPNDELGIIRMADIIAASCVVFDISEAELKSGSRRRCLARARQVATYTARRVTGLSYPFIARTLGGLDHSTCIHGDRKIAEMVREDDEKIRAKVFEVRRLLRAGGVRQVYREHIAERAA